MLHTLINTIHFHSINIQHVKACNELYNIQYISKAKLLHLAGYMLYMIKGQVYNKKLKYNY